MNKSSDELIGKIIGSLEILSCLKRGENDSIYQCRCKKCGYSHAVLKTNLSPDLICPTCPSKKINKSPISDVVNLFGGLLGIDNSKKAEIDSAFEKLNEPEFKDVYSSLERASKSIKDVMNGNSGAPDVARKVLEIEATNLRNAFSGLVNDGKITEEEARIFKTEINSSANMQKLRSVLDVMKQQQQREAKKIQTNQKKI